MECSTISIKINGKKNITQSILVVAYKTCRSRGELAKALKGTMIGGRGARQTRRRSRSQTKVMWPTQRHHKGTHPQSDPIILSLLKRC